MHRHHTRWSHLTLLLGAVTLALLRPALAEGDALTAECSAYSVDVARERAALLSLEAAPALAADATAPPTLASGMPYRLRLSAQQGFAFATPPERRQLDDGAYAGLATFSVPTTGLWRISLGGPSWIDIVDAAGSLVAAGRFEGRHGCVGLRKWVEFPLSADVDYTLQLSGSTASEITVLVSAASTPMP